MQMHLRIEWRNNLRRKNLYCEYVEYLFSFSKTRTKEKETLYSYSILRDEISVGLDHPLSFQRLYYSLSHFQESVFPFLFFFHFTIQCMVKYCNPSWKKCCFFCFVFSKYLKIVWTYSDKKKKIAIHGMSVYNKTLYIVNIGKFIS